ncbi:MAG: Hsp70 family protein, partial [Pseudomonadota bacterium]
MTARKKSGDDKHPPYIVGIDLGTTHTVVAYADSEDEENGIRLFEVEQLVSPGETSRHPLLPSVRYHPAKGELNDNDIRLPWTVIEGDAPPPVVGELARVLGAKTRGRTIVSAKSWLSHPSVDPTAAILPWGASDDVAKISPVEASASYLSHVRFAWNARFPDAPLERQDIVVTVPASFDEAARTLTIEAARLAGLKNIRLLEEPQAVCYDWLNRHRHDLRKSLKNIHLLLVCDVGGGTTDLTLIKVEPGANEPKLTRIGVGDHLMLGGDNVDLTLAHLVEKRLLADGKRLAPGDFSQLVEQCRLAKERLLAEDGPESLKITLLGAGAKVIGGARSTELGRDEVRDVALEGFFPKSNYHDVPDRKRSGIVEFGLPYAPEPAVSKHIGAFLNQHKQVALDALGEETDTPVPDAILLNGGVFRSQVITQRVLELLSHWRGGAPRHLENLHPELAVAYGAVAYSMARRGKQIKIGGGSARSYFLLVDSEQSEIAQGVCILPRGSEEGVEVVLESRSFALRLGEPVRFHLVSSVEDIVPQAGDLVDITEEGFHSLPPLAVALDKKSLQGASEATVKIAAALTELGTLNIQCLSVVDPSQRWDVAFQLRKSGIDDGLRS